jgi:hypothetical protein
MGREGMTRFNNVLAWEHQREPLLRAYEQLVSLSKLLDNAAS